MDTNIWDYDKYSDAWQIAHGKDQVSNTVYGL